MLAFGGDLRKSKAVFLNGDRFFSRVIFKGWRMVHLFHGVKTL
jgi:hypothetical protein